MLDLESIFANVNGSSFVGIDSLTDVKVNKKHNGGLNPHYGNITKVMRNANVMVFQNKKTNAYENMVHRRLIAEGKNPNDFVLGNRIWGTRIPDTPFVEHIKDGVKKMYLEVIFLKPGKVEYFYNGNPIDVKNIIGLPSYDSPDGQGGLDNTVIIRVFSFESIVCVRIDSEEYK